MFENRLVEINRAGSIKPEFSVHVTDYPDEDDVVVELIHGDQVVASIRETDDGSLRIQIYPRPLPGWDFDLGELQEWLERARERWKALGPKRDLRVSPTRNGWVTGRTLR